RYRGHAKATPSGGGSPVEQEAPTGGTLPRGEHGLLGSQRVRNAETQGCQTRGRETISGQVGHFVSSVTTGTRGLLRNAAKLLQSGLDGAAGALAARDDEHRVVTRDRADDLGPPRGVDREPERLRAARRRFHDE